MSAVLNFIVRPFNKVGKKNHNEKMQNIKTLWCLSSTVLFSYRSSHPELFQKKPFWKKYTNVHKTTSAWCPFVVNFKACNITEKDPVKSFFLFQTSCFRRYQFLTKPWSFGIWFNHHMNFTFDWKYYFLFIALIFRTIKTF